MKILSIDTSGKFCSISIHLPDNINEKINSIVPLSHSAELAQNVKKIINKYNVKIKELSFIVINIGPGSFTGLRIGLSFAKGLSYSNNIPLIPINSFSIMKHKVGCSKKTFYYAIYSHKNYVYAKKYNFKETSKSQLLNLENKIKEPIYLYGLDEIGVYKFNNIIKVDFDSSDLIKLGAKEFKNNNLYELNSINPIYIDYNNES